MRIHSPALPVHLHNCPFNFLLSSEERGLPAVTRGAAVQVCGQPGVRCPAGLWALPRVFCCRNATDWRKNRPAGGSDKEEDDRQEVAGQKSVDIAAQVRCGGDEEEEDPFVVASEEETRWCERIYAGGEAEGGRRGQYEVLVFKNLKIKISRHYLVIFDLLAYLMLLNVFMGPNTLPVPTL